MPDSTPRETLTGLLLKDQNEEGSTCLHEALIHGHEDLASFLLMVVLELELEPLFCLNKEEKSPLYLATEADGSSYCLWFMLQQIIENQSRRLRLRGKSPVQTAIMKRNTSKSSATIYYFLNLFSTLF